MLMQTHTCLTILAREIKNIPAESSLWLYLLETLDVKFLGKRLVAAITTGIISSPVAARRIVSFLTGFGFIHL